MIPDSEAHKTEVEKLIIGNIIPPPKGIPVIKGIIPGPGKELPIAIS